MKINENQLNWFLKVTDSSIEDLITWFKKWDKAGGEYGRTDMPCVSLFVGRYCGFSISTRGRGRHRGIFEDSQEVFFNEGARLIDSRNLWGIAAKFVRDAAFRAELIQTLEQLKKERV